MNDYFNDIRIKRGVVKITKEHKVLTSQLLDALLESILKGIPTLHECSQE